MANSNEMRPATALTAPELVAYQDGAVVSRTLIRRAGGSMTLFAFDEGQGLTEHTSPFDAIAHVLDGEASITVAGTSHTVKAGQFILLPANQPHAVAAAVTRFRMLLTMIRAA